MESLSAQRNESSAEVSPAFVEIGTSQVKQKALELGFHKVGIAAIDEGVIESEQQRLQAWLALGYHADMAWMANPKRQDIRFVMPEVRSLICVALNYYTPHQRPQGQEYAKISRYGWGRDYHKVLHKKLKALANWLQTQGEGTQARYYADTGPIQDKVWAQQAGIGWIAKNGNVITREYGSWVFLGEVLTNLDLTPDKPHTEHCGTCTRCIDACPTGAIAQPFIVDANRCIAYHTIENRSEKLPEGLVTHSVDGEIASPFQGWVAGCDICQDVCPWNQRFAQETDTTEFQPYPGNVAPTLTELAKISDQEWQQRFPASALRRIKPEMLRRNARVTLGSQEQKIVDAIQNLQSEIPNAQLAINDQPMIKVIIFDFDGTIADTFEAIASISNRLSVRFGYKQATQEDLIKIKNLSSQQVIRQSGIPFFKLPFILRKLKSELNNVIHRLSPVDGINQVLTELKTKGYQLGIITSNNQENVRIFLQKNDLQNLFDFVYSGTTIFGKSKVIKKFLKQTKFQPEEVIYVGDETRDIEAAKKSQIKVIAVSWGFNSKEVLAKHHPDFLIEQPQELMEVIGSFQKQAS